MTESARQTEAPSVDPHFDIDAVHEAAPDGWYEAVWRRACRYPWPSAHLRAHALSHWVRAFLGR